jgi:hypothetical protein
MRMYSNRTRREPLPSESPSPVKKRRLFLLFELCWSHALRPCRSSGHSEPLLILLVLLEGRNLFLFTKQVRVLARASCLLDNFDITPLWKKRRLGDRYVDEAAYTPAVKSVPAS